MAENKRKRPEFTEDERKRIISDLLERGSQENGEFRLARGALQAVAKKFDCSHTTIGRIWKRAQQSREDPNIQAYRATPQKKGRCGPQPLYDREEVAEAIAALPIRKRRTIRSIAAALGISKSTIHRIKEEDNDFIMPHSNAIKPYLTEENKVTRLSYAALEVEHLPSGRYVFHDGNNVVHIDEKWFWLTQKNYKYYITTGEIPRHRTAKHKNWVVKVMFLAATARPRYDGQGNCTFDGKIGIWPFIKKVRAKRRSRNRAAGTVETKCISVDKPTYKRFVLEKVIPAIKAKWPRDNNINRVTVRLQHDNATSHFGEDDEDWVDCCFENRHLWRFELKEQPANSPDTNILDLSFFRALQSLQFLIGDAHTIDELIANVKEAWRQYEARKIYYVFLTHQTCMAEIIRCNGGIDYKIPHMGKERLDRHGALPHRVDVPADVVDRLSDLDLLP